MRSTVLVVWVCLWASQCLCHQLPPYPIGPSSSPHAWSPSYGHNVISQTPSFRHNVTTQTPELSNDTPVRRRMLPKATPHNVTTQKPAIPNNSPVTRTSPRAIPQPVPGITDSTRHNAENTSKPEVTTDNIDKVHRRNSTNYSRERNISSPVLPPITTTNAPTHTAGKRFSTVNDSTRDKGSHELPTEDPHSDHDHESSTRPSLSFIPAPDEPLMDMADSFLIPQDLPATENTGGLLSLRLSL